MASCSIHTCLLRTAENERLRAKYKRLKCKYTVAAKAEGKENCERSVAQTNSISTQTARVHHEEEKETTQHTVKLLQTHAALVRKYEKELSLTTEQSEKISQLTINKNKLTEQLKDVRDKHRTSKVALTHSKHQNETRLKTLQEELFQVTADRDTVQYKYDKLKAEMRGIDQQFFEEIEDLKYALQESAKLNRVYEKSLKSMCKKYSLQYPGVVNGKSPKSESFVKENLPKEDPGSWQR